MTRLRTASGKRRGETVETQYWSESKLFPGTYSINEKGPALGTARSLKASHTIWTDGSRLTSGMVGAAWAWKTIDG